MVVFENILPLTLFMRCHTLLYLQSFKLLWFIPVSFDLSVSRYIAGSELVFWYWGITMFQPEFSQGLGPTAHPCLLWYQGGMYGTPQSPVLGFPHVKLMKKWYCEFQFCDFYLEVGCNCISSTFWGAGAMWDTLYHPPSRHSRRWMSTNQAPRSLPVAQSFLSYYSISLCTHRHFRRL